MIEQQRKDAILCLLELHRVVSLHDVVEAAGASESTIRRDFIELERENRLVRVRGGVQMVPNAPVAANASHETSFDRRATINREKKRRIARKACSLLENGETIFIDGGTTTFQMAEFLSTFSLKIVTNSFTIARYLVKHSKCTVILPEGTIDPDSLLILNNLTPDPFSNYTASKAFMGTEGITESVLTNSETLLIQAERAMINHAQEVIILADDSKFGRIGHLTLCPIEKASKIITTRNANEQLVAKLRDKGIQVIQV